MKINYSLDDVFYSFEHNGETVQGIDEDNAIAIMLIQGPLFVAEGKETVELFVNCNDVFALACGDAEAIELEEIGDLFRMWREDPVYGATKWCALHRGIRPHELLEADMRSAGVWDEEMESLGKAKASDRQLLNEL